MLGKGKIHNRTGRHPKRLRKSTAKPTQQKTPRASDAVSYSLSLKPQICALPQQQSRQEWPQTQLITSSPKLPKDPARNPFPSTIHTHGVTTTDPTTLTIASHVLQLTREKVRRVVLAARCRSTCKVSPRFLHESDVRVSTTTACRYALIKYISDKASKSEVLNAVPCGFTIVPFGYCT